MAICIDGRRCRNIAGRRRFLRVRTGRARLRQAIRRRLHRLLHRKFLRECGPTSLLHEDPRYYQLGHGKIITHALWAAGSTGWCKRDDGTWGPNYANVTGNLIVPPFPTCTILRRNVPCWYTLQRGLTVTVEGAIGAELIEFWPDIAAHYKRKKQRSAPAKRQRRILRAPPSPLPDPRNPRANQPLEPPNGRPA